MNNKVSKKYKIFLISIIFLAIISSFFVNVSGQIITTDQSDDIYVVDANNQVSENVDLYPFLDILNINITNNNSIVKITFKGNLDFNDTKKQFSIYIFENSGQSRFDPVLENITETNFLLLIEYDTITKKFDITNTGPEQVFGISTSQKVITINTSYTFTIAIGIISYRLDIEKNFRIYDFSPEEMNKYAFPFLISELPILTLILIIIVVSVLILLTIILIIGSRRTGLGIGEFLPKARNVLIAIAIIFIVLPIVLILTGIITEETQNILIISIVIATVIGVITLLVFILRRRQKIQERRRRVRRRRRVEEPIF